MTRFSAFGEKFSRKSGISRLMEDLGAAMSGGGLHMLGGGNPAHIPEVQARFRRAMERLLAKPGAFEATVGNYDGPRGNASFLAATAELLTETLGRRIGPENLVLTNGSQNAFFHLFNLFAGKTSDGAGRRILLPLTPEYVGYADLGLSRPFFDARAPLVEDLGDRLFKYRIDFDALNVGDDVGAICVSRPTNPSGNVLDDAEMARLDDLAKARGIPLIVDGAYGLPFPGIVHVPAAPFWNENVVLCLSLSKFGLPNLRTGIVVARPDVAAALAEANAVTGLAPGGLGPALALDLMRNGEILRLSREVVAPYFRRKAEFALDVLREELGDLPYRVHRPEGALFLWLRLPGFPVSSESLYERLKERGTLVVPGHHFFPGAEEDPHRHECLRISYAMDDVVVRAGIRTLGETLRALLP